MSTENTVNEQVKATAAENAGTQTATSAENIIKTENAFRIFTTQKEFDDVAKSIKENAMQKAKKEIFSELGLKPEDEAKLSEFKEAYDSQLSTAEKANKAFAELQSKYDNINSTIEEKDLTIAALQKISGKTADEINIIIKMSKGLKSETVSAEKAIETVMSMILPKINDQTQPQIQVQNAMPKGANLNQPDNMPVSEPNPFKKETWDDIKQSLLYKADAQKAKTLAAAAGVKLGW